MRTSARCIGMICLMLLSLCVMARQAQPANPHGAEPLLDAMAVLQISQQALGPAMGTGDGSIDGLAFDPARAEWHFQFAGFGDKTHGSVIVTLNETTGAVCAHDPASSRCIAQGSATAQLNEARERRAAMEEAVRHPAPDLQAS
jgi:hypothetical protein